MFARLRRDEMPLFMDVGSYFMMLGGWFEVCLCIMVVMKVCIFHC